MYVCIYSDTLFSQYRTFSYMHRYVHIQYMHPKSLYVNIKTTMPGDLCHEQSQVKQESVRNIHWKEKDTIRWFINEA